MPISLSNFVLLLLLFTRQVKCCSTESSQSLSSSWRLSTGSG